MRKRWYFPNKENLFIQSQMDESKPLEEIRNWEHPPWYGLVQLKEESNIDFLGESEGSLPQPHDSLPDAGEAINDFWSMSGNFKDRHHVEPRVKLYSPREESFPVDDEIPVQGGSHASSSHEVSLQPTFKRREDLGKHSVYSHFPKDRNCEICQRTKIIRAHTEDAMAKPYFVLKNLVTW